jgi:hypothetical protein
MGRNLDLPRSGSGSGHRRWPLVYWPRWSWMCRLTTSRVAAPTVATRWPLVQGVGGRDGGGEPRAGVAMALLRSLGYQTPWWAHLGMTLLFDLASPTRTAYGHML